MSSELQSSNGTNPLTRAGAIVASVNPPPPPVLILELQSLTRQPDPNEEKIIALVSGEEALAEQVSRLACARQPGKKAKNLSVREVLRSSDPLGFYALVLAAALEKSLDHIGIGSRPFWEHARMIANLCRESARLYAPELQEGAYVLGFFHDVGVPLLQHGLREYPEELVARTLYWDDIVVEDEEETLRVNHCACSFSLARQWKVEDSILEAILFHHDTDFAVHKCEETRKLKALLQLSELAYTANVAFGSSLQRTDSNEEEHLDDILEILKAEREVDLDQYQELVKTTLS